MHISLCDIRQCITGLEVENKRLISKGPNQVHTKTSQHSTTSSGGKSNRCWDTDDFLKDKPHLLVPSDGRVHSAPNSPVMRQRSPRPLPARPKTHAELGK